MQFTFTFNAEQLNIIIAGLNKLPFEVVNGFINGFVEEANRQAKAQQEETEKEGVQAIETTE